MSNYTFGNEQQIIASFQVKETKAVSYLFHLHYTALVDYATRIINNQHEGMDIVINSFIKLLDKSHDFKSLPQLKAYLYVVTRNACNDYLKKLRVSKRYENETLFLEKEAYDQKQFDLVRMDTEIINTLYEEINNLPQQCKEIYDLHFVRSWDTNAIAAHLNISPQTVRNHRSRTVAFLRTALDKKNLLPPIIKLIALKLTLLFF